MNKNKTWKVAVIGCGSFANGQYLPNISKEANAECTAVCDIIPERAQAACAKFGIPAWYPNVYELLEKADFEIAIDATSINSHHEINMAVLGAGKHLITQKPAAPSVEKMNEQIELAKKMGVSFACVPIHPMRYDLNVAKQMIADGTIGRVYYVKCNSSHGGPEYFQYRNTDPSGFYEPGAGALVDMGVHGLQQVTFLMGPAKRVMCMGAVTTPEREIRSGTLNGKILKTDSIPDQYLINLDFGEGRLGFVDCGFSQKASMDPQLQIFGSQGTISITRPYMANTIPDVYIDAPERGIRGWVKPMEWIQRYPRLNSQCCCLRDLVESVEKGTLPLLSGEHARHLIEIMGAVTRTAFTGISVELKTTF